MKIKWGAATDVGRRRSENEDSLLVDGDRQLFAVADGMGGHNAGEVASATAIEALRATYRDPPHLAEAVREANDAVLQKAATDAGYENMGTTLTALAVDGGTATIGHVGDSRAYLLRDGELTQVTDDHSWVEQLVREGKLTPEEAEVHPQRSIVTRALGIEPDVQVDNEAVDLASGDRLLLCSDGLTSMVRENDIAAALRRENDPQRVADGLVEAANRAGGEDNITVIVLDFRDDGKGGRSRSSAASQAGAGDAAADGATGHWDEADAAVAGAKASTKAASVEPPVALTAPDPDLAAARSARRRRLVRIVAFVLPVVILIGAAIGTLGWYARRTFYVGTRSGNVVLYRGVPGGLLGWNPTLERKYRIRVADLQPADRDDVRKGHRFTSPAAANRFARGLQSRSIPPASSTTTTAPAGPPVNTVTSG